MWRRGLLVPLVGLVLISCKASDQSGPSSPSTDAQPPPVAPKDQSLTLEEAVRGIEGRGRLMVSIKTSKGEMIAELFETKTPKTVANFVSLARGLRFFQDVQTGEWVKRPFYDGLTFHRVMTDFMIQGGCPLGNGQGGPGYLFDDEFRSDLVHDRPGILSMVNAGPNTNGSQFIITDREARHLDGRHTVFGVLVEGLDVERAIARAKADADHKPEEPVKIESMTFFRRP